MNLKRTEAILFLILAITLVALEIVSAILAYETIGGVASAMYFAAIGINVVFFAVAVRRPMLAAVGLVLLALVIVPYQFALAQRWIRVQAEATEIVAFAYNQRLSRGQFPSNLAGYRFKDEQTRSYVTAYNPDPSFDGFLLCYKVGTEMTSHCFSPKYGWMYDGD